MNTYYARLLLYLLFTFSATLVRAQIIAPDTVCLGQISTLDAMLKHNDHTWIIDTTDISQYNTTPASASTTISAINTPNYATMTYDNSTGNWYSFITNYNTQDIVRLDYGANPNNPAPSVVNLGNFSFPGYQLEGIQIIQDPSNSSWYGFCVNSDYLLRLDFGTSITNTSPTTTIYNFSGTFAWAHQLSVGLYGTEWIGFVANRNGYITRLDFGTAITNTPSGTNLPLVGSYSNPCNFALHFQNGNWYMLVSNLINGSITRINFGANIKNNTPTGTLLGGTGLVLPRAIAIFKDCNQLFAYVSNETGNMIRLDFNNDISTAPTFTNLGAIGTTSIGSFVPFIYNGIQYLHIISFRSQSFYRKQILTYPTFNTTLYTNPTISYQFTSPGLNRITLLQNTGSFTGMNAYCAEVFVTITPQDIVPDTTICEGDSVVLDATTTGATAYKWSTGDTTAQTIVNKIGTYQVVIFKGSGCAIIDTIQVKTSPNLDIDLGNDIYICSGESVELKNLKSSASNRHLWSNGSTNSSVIVNKPGLYWLEESINGHCKSRDSILLIEKPSPKVYLGEDTIICAGDTITINATYQDTGGSFTWNTHQTSQSIKAYEGGIYWVRATNNEGCSDADSISIRVITAPQVNLTDDTTFCYGESYELYAGIFSGASYYWSDGTHRDRIHVSQPGKYYVRVENICGIGYDETVIDFKNCEIWFPSAFSPNNDGRNDIARLLGDITSVTNYKLSIFNRWGQVVFYTEDVYKGWDGTYKGKEESINTFYYLIQCSIDGEEATMKGDITLIK